MAEVLVRALADSSVEALRMARTAALVPVAEKVSGEVLGQALLETFQVDLATGVQEVVLAMATLAAAATAVSAAWEQVDLDHSVDLQALVAL